MKHRASHLIPSQQSERGFALPVALGMGLIALLLGMTAVLRAQDDRITAVNKHVASQSQLAAETGISRILDFMNDYRMMAKFNACNNNQWSATNGSGAGSCTNSGSTVNDISWANPGLIPNLNASCGTGTLDTSRTTVQTWTKNSWQAIDTSDASKGEYRLVDYERNGTLTVEGIVKRGQTGESKSIVTVKIPLFNVDNEQIAGLWVRSSISSDPRIDSDVVGPCTGSLSITPLNNKNIIRTQLQMPNAPAQPAVGTGIYSLTNISSLPGTNTTDATGKKLPRLISNNNGTTVDDVPATNGVYNYIVTSLDDSFEFVPGKAVNIWVTGNIDLQGKTIINPCNASGAATSCGPFDVRIYGTGGTGSTLTLNQGTVVCDVFVHMPNYAATFNTSGSNTRNCGGSIKNSGVYWLNSWSGANGTNSITTPRAVWLNALNATTMSVPPPRLGAVQEWNPETATSSP
jgi:Tfp pilus assembly protein PilX